VRDDPDGSRILGRSEPPPGRPSLTAICNEAAALHPEHFGRGPGAFKSHVKDGVVACLLSDPFTPPKRTLIETGKVDRLRPMRGVHRDLVSETYGLRMAATIGRPVSAYLSSISVEPDMVLDVFVLGPGQGPDPSTYCRFSSAC
jgi:uncharacterized protein YbcI